MQSESITRRRIALRSALISLFVLIGLTVAIWVAHAATRTWDGGSAIDGNWQTAANWQSDLAPVAGDDLVFGNSPRTSSFNNFIAGTSFNTITLGLGGNNLTGNAVSLNAGISMTGGSINLTSIKLNNAQTFSSVSGGGGIINSAIDLNGNALTVAGPGTIQFNGAITGSAGLVKNDSGRMDLFGSTANSYSGQTIINDGLLQIAKAPGVPAVSSSLVIGDGVGAVNSAVTRQYQDAQIPQQVTVNSDGLYDLNSFIETITTLSINRGSVSIGTGQLEPVSGVTMTGGTISSTGAGKLLLSTNVTANSAPAPLQSINGRLDLNASSRTFTVNNDNDDTTFDLLDLPAIISNGSLTKAGAGALWLRGANTYSGTTTLIAGDLVIDGNQPQSAVQVNGGTLRSNLGTTGPVTVTAGRLSDPGSCSAPSFNKFTVQGNLSLSSAAFYRATICGSENPTFQNARVVITGNGTVTLGDSTLEINNLGSGNFAPGRTFIVIDNDGTEVVLGTFKGLPEGASITVGNAKLFISYHGGDGNDVVLHVSGSRSWDGGSSRDSNWTTKENWEGDVAPAQGDSLIFPANVLRLSNTHDFPLGTAFNSISFTGPGGGYFLRSNAVVNTISLNIGITATNTAGSNTVDLSAIRLDNNQSFTSTTAGTTLTVSSAIDTNGQTLSLDGAGAITLSGSMSGNGGVTKFGTNTAILSGGNNYTGTTNALAGTLLVNGSQASSNVSVNGGTLGGTGTIGATTLIVGTIDPGGAGNGTGILNSGPMTFGVGIGGQFNVDLNGTTAGIGYDRLNVSGPVTFNNSILNVSLGSGFTPAPGDTFIIINNDGTDAVGGTAKTFDGKPEASSFTVGGTTFRISYIGGDGNDVVLHVPGSRSWDGGSPLNSNWTTKENWVGDVAPGIGDSLIFPNTLARQTNVNDFPAVTSFNSISILSSGYNLSGNAVALTNGIVGAGTIGFAIRLAANQTFNSNFGAAYALQFNGNIDTNGYQLILDGNSSVSIYGVISGTGELTKLGTEIHALFANNSYTGPTTIMDGQLTIAGNQPGSAIQVNGGSLAGTGTVKSITATSGSVIPLLVDPNGDHISVSGNAIFGPSANYQTTLSTTVAGLKNTRLDVAGTVTLGGSTLVTQIINGGDPNAHLGDTVVIINNGGTGPVQGTFNGLPEGSVYVHSPTNFRVSYIGGDGNDVTLTVVPAAGANSIQFNAPNYNASESGKAANVVVTRVGDTSGAATVHYATTDGAGLNNCNVINGAASSRCDYETTVGTLRFGGGETSKTISILLIDDSYAEGNEGLTLTLSDPTGASLGAPSIAAITINDNENVNGTNPIDTPDSFVRQHYLDFLNREPDAAGLAYWSNQITECQQPGATCNAEIRRVNVSAAFFLSIEFQETGYLVERLYKSAYGDAVGTSNFGATHQIPVPVIRFIEFLPDTQQIGKDVIVGQPGWEQQLENNKVAFTSEFVQRARFTSEFPPTMTPAQFVDTLFLNAGVTPSAGERTSAIDEFGGAGTSTDTAARGRALRRVAQNSTLNKQEFNRAFVLMQYFGYLRRNPNEIPDADYSGYDFWLTKLNEFNGNFVSAEMVKAFIVSGEYRQRFGP